MRQVAVAFALGCFANGQDLDHTASNSPVVAHLAGPVADGTVKLVSSADVSKAWKEEEDAVHTLQEHHQEVTKKTHAKSRGLQKTMKTKRQHPKKKAHRSEDDELAGEDGDMDEEEEERDLHEEDFDEEEGEESESMDAMGDEEDHKEDDDERKHPVEEHDEDGDEDNWYGDLYGEERRATKKTHASKKKVSMKKKKTTNTKKAPDYGDGYMPVTHYNKKQNAAKVYPQPKTHNQEEKQTTRTTPTKTYPTPGTQKKEHAVTYDYGMYGGGHDTTSTGKAKDEKKTSAKKVEATPKKPSNEFPSSDKMAEKDLVDSEMNKEERELHREAMRIPKDARLGAGEKKLMEKYGTRYTSSLSHKSENKKEHAREEAETYEADDMGDEEPPVDDEPVDDEESMESMDGYGDFYTGDEGAEDEAEEMQHQKKTVQHAMTKDVKMEQNQTGNQTATVPSLDEATAQADKVVKGFLQTVARV